MRTFTQKLAFLLLAAFCCVGVQLKATEVTIGDPTSTTTSSYLPWYSYYKYGYSQQIYTATEIEEAGGGAGTINSLTLLLKGSLNKTFSFEIYMKEIDRAAFTSTTDWEVLSSADLVYSGTLTPNYSSATAVTFTLASPFGYNGGNLLIAIRNNTGDYESGLSSVTTTVDANQALYAYRDSPGEYDLALSGITGTKVSVKSVITLDMTTSAVTCEKPTAVDVTGVTANSATVNFSGGGSSIYVLQYKKSSVSSWDDAEKVSNLTTTSYTIEGLESNTAYDVRVSCVCGDATSSPKAASFTTAIALPYLETFDKSSTPSGWSNKSGLLNQDLSVTLTDYTPSGYSGWTMGEGNGVFNSHAKIDVYGASCKYWLISPAIPMIAGQQLSFDVALTAYSGTLSAPGTTGTDDRFIVLASIDGGDNWAILREWNNAGSEFVYNDIACSATGDEIVIEIDDAYANQTVLFALYAESTISNADNYLHVDNFKIAAIPSCLKPDSLVATAVTKNSISIDWKAKSGETEWKVQYKKAADTDYTTIDGVVAHPYTITGLEAYTSYNIRVAAVCTEETTDYGKVITVKTAAGVPFEQSFNVLPIPSDWKRYVGSWEEVENGAELEEVPNGWAASSKPNGVFPDSSYHIILNLKDTVYRWVVSPTIEMEAGYQLTFNLALTKSSGTLQPVTAGQQNSQKFYVAVSEDGGASWSTLNTWTSEGAKFDAINASATGQVVKIDLSSFAGKRIKLAFYGESQKASDAETGDNNLHIQNFKIAPIPACENSGTLDVTAVAGTTASLQWDNEDGATWQYFYRVKAAEAYTPVEADWANSTSERFVNLSGLQETTSYVFYLRRHCDTDNNSEPRLIEFTTIQTPATLPFSDNFEASNKWVLINGTQTNAWTWGSATQKDGAKSLYISNDGGTSYAYTPSGYYYYTYSYATKSFYFDEAGVYSFSFDWKGTGYYSYSTNYAYLRVALAPISAELVAESSFSGLSASAVPTGWLALDGGSALNQQSDWQHVSTDLNIEAAGNYKVVLFWYDNGSSGSQPAAIDNFSIVKVNCTKPSGLELDGDPTASSASFQWNDDQDGNTWAYAYALASAGAPDEAAYIDVDNNSIEIDGLAENSSYIFYLRKNCGANGYSEAIQLPFKTLNPYQITINEGTITNSYVPIYGSWVDDYTRSQFIIPAATLENIAWDTITNLTFYSSTSSINWGVAEFEVYMAEVANASFSSTSYTDWSSLIKVKNAGSLSVVNGEMTVALDAPFQYKGGNLLIGFYQTVEGSYVASPWYGVSTTGASLAGYSSSAGADGSPSQQGFLPKMAIDFKIGQAPSCSTPKGLVAVADSLKSDSAFIRWTEQGVASTWILRYRKSGVEKWDSLTLNIDSLWLEGLTPATTYEVQVASWCDPSDEETITDFTGSVEFTTACAAISAFPYIENFDGLTLTSEYTPSKRTLPICWSAINATTYSSAQVYPSVYYYSYTDYSNSAPNSLRFYSYYSSSYPNYAKDQYAVLPEMEGINGLRIKFNARKYDSSYAADFVVGVMSDPEDESTFVGIDTLAPASTAYESFKVSFASYAGEGKHIAIMLKAAAPIGTATYAYSGLYLDDVLVEEIPACQEPEDLAIAAGVDSITSTTALLTWKALNGESAWTLQYRKASETEWSSVAANANPFELSGLTPSTIYYARVAAACSSENSAYSDSISFITECAAITVAELPYSQNFDDVTGLPLCWTKINTTTASYYQSYPTVSSKELFFYSYSSSSPQDQYAILPEMENINTLRIKFDARRYSTYNADFVIGVMSDPADTATFVVIDSIKPASSTAAAYEVKLNKALASAKHIAIKLPKATSSYRAVYIDNVVVEEVPPCLEPAGVISVKDITDAGATLFWDNEESTSWKYAVALAAAGEPADDAFIAISDTFKVFDNLSENSAYTFFLRRACESLSSPSISASFTTKQTPADPLAFTDDFEGAIGWQFINGDLTNAWTIDTAAHKDGAKAMYISNDGGKHNKYTLNSAAMVYATKLFNFTETGTYKVEFDWLAGGEGDSYPSDYMRVALIPDSIALVAGTSAPSGFSGSALPQAWNTKALDGGSKLNLKTSWQHSSSEVLVENAGLYKVVFAWRNDGSVGNDTAATVDNFSIEKLSCVRPSALAAKLTEGNGSIATLTWKKGDQETAWVLNYSLKADLSDSIEVAVTDTFINLTGLQSDSTYYARVLSVCGGTRTNWTEAISFTPTNAITLTINKGTQTNSLVPISSTYLYQYNYEEGSRSQFIIPADSLTDVQWGKIKQLTFFSSQASFAFGNATFEVYMAEAPETTFASDAFTAWTSMEKVMSEASLAVDGNQMVVTLDQPYDYAGGNLMIGIKSIASAYISSSCYWQGVTATNAAVASEYDYDYWSGYTEEPARQNFLPKMAIQYNPGEEPACLKPTGLSVAYNGGDSAVVNWTSDAASWNIDVNGVVTAVSAKPYTIHGLSLATAYAVKVQAVCGQDNLSEWTSAKSFATDLCNAEDQQSISYTLSDSYGDGWNGGATLKVVHKATSKEIASLTLSDGYSSNGTLPLCCGEEYSFVWVSGSYDSECSFVIKDLDDATILSKSGPSAGSLGDYTMVCPTCFKPSAVAIPDSTITATSAIVHWTAGHSSQTEWQIAYDTLTSNQPDTLPSFKNVTVIPDTLKQLLPEHTYFVYVRAYCGQNDSSKWAPIKSFTTASLCQKPDGLAAANITSASASIKWNTYGQTGFNLRYSTDGVNWTVVNNIETSPYAIESSLEPSTSYQVQVQAVCDETKWSTALTFKTACEAFTIPFAEDFESDIDCWTMVNEVSGTGVTASAGENTTNGFAFKWGTNPPQYLISPELEALDAQLELEFMYNNYSTSYAETFHVGYSTTTNDTSAFIWGEEISISNTVWTAYVDTLPAGVKYVAIKCTSYDKYYLFIDNFSVSRLTNCAKPTDLTVSDVFAHEAKLSWTAGAEAQTAWQIALDTIPTNKPDTLPSTNIIDVTTNPYVLSGLLPQHTYYAYVRANCGDEVSRWSNRVSFTTTIACPAPTALEAVLTPGNGAIATLKWIAGGNENDWVVEYSLNANLSDSIEVLATDTFVNITGLTSDQKYYARVKADCGDLDGKSLYSAIISFTPTDKYELLLNDGTTTNNNVPIYGNWVDNKTRSQFIIPAADLASIEWDSIQSLTFYGAFSGTRTSWGDAQFEVYVAEAEETTLSALADWNELDKVMAAAALALEDGKMVVTFDAPYQYQGGNLLIGIYQTVSGDYAACNWYGVSAANGASMGGYGTSINKQSFLPKMLIEYVPGVEPACITPKNLHEVEHSATKATLAWKAMAGAAWEYAVVRKDVNETPQYVSTSRDTAVVDNLLPQTDYIFYLRRNCGENGYSEVVSVEFTTDAFVASVPFSDDFEGVNNWKFVNDATNAWVVGSATSNGGNQSLYISSDGGATNEYDFDEANASFATLLINLVEDTTYVVEYDWHAEGEYYEDDGAIDYLRVGIVPATSAITAGSASLPAGWIALDGDTTLTEQTDWTHMKQELALNAGQYKIVFAWFNDDSDGENPPAAIDNFSIVIKPSIPTGFGGVDGEGFKAIKFMRDNHVYILVNGVIYDATGRLVEK